MRLQLIGLLSGLSIISASAFAEPQVQAGETLESLSQAKVTTTINGQPGSLQDLVSSGKVQIVGDANSAQQAPAQGAIAATDQDIPAQQTEPAQAPINPNAAAIEATTAPAAAELQLEDPELTQPAQN